MNGREKCDICGGAYKKTVQIRATLRGVTRKTTYKCQKCGSKFTDTIKLVKKNGNALQAAAQMAALGGAASSRATSPSPAGGTPTPRPADEAPPPGVTRVRKPRRKAGANHGNHGGLR